MAGTIFGLGRSQQVGANGRPLGGCLLYLYEANTSTPVDAFSDYALTNIHQFPIVADSAGRLPSFWLADGTYRVRLTTSAGVTVFDDQAITAIGPSSGESGGSTAVDTETIHQTGDMIWNPASGTRSGWVRSNGRTISSGSGSGTERANGDCEALFAFLWNNFSNSLCAVGGGRGASATADWAANKAIATLDMRGMAGFGLDDMGNSAAGVITGATTPGDDGTTAGAQTVSITVAQANLPNVNFTVTGTGVGDVASHTHSVGTLAVGNESSHTHGAGTFAVGTSITNGSNVVHGTGTDGADTSGNDATNGITSATFSALSLASGSVSGTSAAGSSHTHTLSGATAAATPAVTVTSLTANAASGGLGTAISTNNLPPYRCGTWYIKL